MIEPTADSKPSQSPSRLKRIGLAIGGVLGVALIAIQFVPVSAMTNPTEHAKFDDAKDIEAVLRRACYDCHSNDVTWPWYSRIAPASWLVARDVVEGRKAFNFSEWPEDKDDRQFNREQVYEIIESGEMPPWFYIYPMHMDAKLSEADMALLKKWSSEKADEEEEEEE